MGVFFFQAEDGIRDIGVTGVQTCALPIYVEVQFYSWFEFYFSLFLIIVMFDNLKQKKIQFKPRKKN